MTVHSCTMQISLVHRYNSCAYFSSLGPGDIFPADYLPAIPKLRVQQNWIAMLTTYDHNSCHND
jgi:hypothetical protein